MMERVYKTLIKSGITVVYRRKTTSTLDLARQLVSDGCTPPTLIIAETQTQGRGRNNRVFLSAKGGIYMTVILKSPPIEKLNLVTPAAAVSVVDAILEVCGIDTKIKWVNDVFVGNRKVCGILTENVADKHGDRYIIVGIGINLVQPKGGYPVSLQNIITSLFDFEPRGIRAKLIENVYKNVVSLCSEPYNIATKYREKLLLLGRTVILEDGSEVIVEDIDDACGLIVLHADGQKQTLRTGEVSIKLKDF